MEHLYVVAHLQFYRVCCQSVVVLLQAYRAYDVGEVLHIKMAPKKALAFCLNNYF